jgi:hypothetical protein
MTTQRVACPSCKSVLQAGEKLFGKQVRCPKCQTILNVPAAADAPASSAAPTAGWYVAINKQKVGPFSPAQLRRLASEGKIRAEDMIHRDGEPKWVAAGSLQGLFPTKSRPVELHAIKPAPAPEAVRDAGGGGAPPARPRPAARFPSRRGLVLAAGGGLLALLLAVGLIGYVAFRGSGKDDGGNPADAEHLNDLDTAFVADHFIGAVVVHPRRVLRSPALAALPQDQLFEGLAAQGLDPRSVERAVVLFDSAPGGNDPFLPAGILHFAEAVDGKKSLQALFPKPRTATFQGKTYYNLGQQFTPEPLSVYLHGERTVLAASEVTLLKMLSAGAAKAPLADRLRRVNLDHDLVAVCAVEPVRPAASEAMKGSMKDAPPQFADAEKLPEYLQWVTLSLDLSGEQLLGLEFDARDDDAAGEVLKLVDAARDYLKVMYPSLRRDLMKSAPPDLAKPLGAFADDLANGISAGRDGTRVTVRVTLPRGLPDLVGKLAPLLEQMRKGPGPNPPRPSK